MKEEDKNYIISDLEYLLEHANAIGMFDESNVRDCFYSLKEYISNNCNEKNDEDFVAFINQRMIDIINLVYLFMDSGYLEEPNISFLDYLLKCCFRDLLEYFINGME